MITDEKLMRYVDGELSPAECREVERELAGAPELSKKRDALLEMREVLRARFELAETEADPLLDPLWERVKAGLPAAPLVHAQHPGVFARFRDWFETYRSHFVTGAVAAVAGALVATVVTSRLASTLPRGAAGPQSAEVESLEVLGGSGMVFEEPADKSDTGTTVIWVSANEDDDDDSANPGGDTKTEAPL